MWQNHQKGGRLRKKTECFYDYGPKGMQNLRLFQRLEWRNTNN